MRALLMIFICSVTLAAQQASAPLVTNQDLLAGLPSDGSKWLIYHGNYFGHRYSPLTQITPQNVNQLKAQWTFQTRISPNFQSTPIFVDNVLYVTGFGGYVWAIDARTGRQIWQYRKQIPGDFRGCCGPNNRGMAVLGDTLFLGTGDAHLIALDMKTGTRCVGRRARQLQTRIFNHRCAAGRERQSDRRHGGRRIRHSRLHRGLRRQHGEESLAILYSGRAG